MYLCAHVMVDLVVWSVEVCSRRNVGEATSDVVSKRAVWIENKTVGGAE